MFFLFFYTLLGSCLDYHVPDVPSTIVHAVQEGRDGWDGATADIFFSNDDDWMLRCTGVGGGPFDVTETSQVLECDFEL